MCGKDSYGNAAHLSGSRGKVDNTHRVRGSVESRHMPTAMIIQPRNQRGSIDSNMRVKVGRSDKYTGK